MHVAHFGFFDVVVGDGLAFHNVSRTLWFPTFEELDGFPGIEHALHHVK